MADKIEDAPEEGEENVSKARKKDHKEPIGDSSSDLRALLLILLLTVIVFFILLYKQRHPQEYAASVVQAKENADAAYSKAEEILPKAYRGIGWFFQYVLDYGKASESSVEVPEARTPSDAVGPEAIPAVSTGSVAGTDEGAVSIEATGSLGSPKTPLVLEISGYRLEFDGPPAEAVVLSFSWAKMTVSPVVPKEEINTGN